MANYCFAKTTTSPWKKSGVSVYVVTLQSSNQNSGENDLGSAWLGSCGVLWWFCVHFCNLGYKYRQVLRKKERKQMNIAVHGDLRGPSTFHKELSPWARSCCTDTQRLVNLPAFLTHIKCFWDKGQNFTPVAKTSILFILHLLKPAVMNSKYANIS